MADTQPRFVSAHALLREIMEQIFNTSKLNLEYSDIHRPNYAGRQRNEFSMQLLKKDLYVFAGVLGIGKTTLLAQLITDMIVRVQMPAGLIFMNRFERDERAFIEKMFAYLLGRNISTLRADESEGKWEDIMNVSSALVRAFDNDALVVSSPDDLSFDNLYDIMSEIKSRANVETFFVADCPIVHGFKPEGYGFLFPLDQIARELDVAIVATSTCYPDIDKHLSKDTHLVPTDNTLAHPASFWAMLCDDLPKKLRTSFEGNPPLEKDPRPSVNLILSHSGDWLNLAADPAKPFFEEVSLSMGPDQRLVIEINTRNQSSVNKELDDEFPEEYVWETDARKAVEKALKLAFWDAQSGSVTFHEPKDPLIPWMTASSIEEVESFLAELAGIAFGCSAPVGTGHFDFDCIALEIVEAALENYTDALRAVFGADT